MPFINVKITKALKAEQTDTLKAELGEAITVFPGKSEAYLMVCIQDDQKMYFKGVGGDTAFVEVKLFGGVASDAAEKFTSKVCTALEKLGIPGNRTYVRYEGSNDWGYNFMNF